MASGIWTREKTGPQPVALNQTLLWPQYLSLDLNQRSPRYEQGALDQTKLERHIIFSLLNFKIGQTAPIHASDL